MVGIGKVSMRIHETRQQRGIAQIDDLRACGNFRIRSDAGDLSGIHHDQTRRDDAVALAVEHAGGLNHERAIGRGKGARRTPSRPPKRPRSDSS